MTDILLPNDGKLEQIATVDLYPSPLNTYDASDLSDLVNSIRACGLLTPFTVVGPNEKGKYEILSGERRYRAIQQLNEETEGAFSAIPCYVVGGTDLNQIIKQLVIELANLETRNDFDRDAHRLQVIALYNDLAENGTVVERSIVARVGKALGVSDRYARMYNSIFKKAIPELKESVSSNITPSDQKKAMDNGEETGTVHIPVHIAARASNLPENVQKEIVNRVNAGEKPKEVLQEYVTAVKGPELNSAFNTSAKTKTTVSTSTAKPKYKPQFDDGYYDEDEFGHGIGGHKQIWNGEEDEEDDLYDGASVAEDATTDLYDFPDDLDDVSGEDCMAFLRNSNRTDLSIDTAGKIGSLKRDSNSSDAKAMIEAEQKTVSNWLKRMLKITDYDALEDAEKELLQMVVELSRQYQTSEN